MLLDKLSLTPVPSIILLFFPFVCMAFLYLERLIGFLTDRVFSVLGPCPFKVTILHINCPEITLVLLEVGRFENGVYD